MGNKLSGVLGWRATPVDELEQILDRRVSIDSLAALINALSSEEKRVYNLAETAIVLDSSVFLRLAKLKRSADIVDYLTSERHSAPLIIPGQAIQEFWNNQLHVVDTVAASLRKKFDLFKTDVEKAGTEILGSLDAVGGILEDFEKRHGYIYDESTAHATLNLLKALKQSAAIPYVPRLRFKDIASHRKRTKTPPGFRDDGDGDFFIWADALLGLRTAKCSGKFSNVVLVTEDKKIDWSRNGVPHPILSAELKLYLGVDLRTWSLEDLDREVTKAIGAG